MSSIFQRLVVVSALVASALPVAACSSSSSSSGVDTQNGKAISSIDIGSDVTIDKGTTKQVTATVKYADGTSTDVTKSSELLWNIGDSSVATITSDGVLTGVKVGATTIKATYQGNESASHAIVVH